MLLIYADIMHSARQTATENVVKCFVHCLSAATPKPMRPNMYSRNAVRSQWRQPRRCRRRADGATKCACGLLKILNKRNSCGKMEALRSQRSPHSFPTSCRTDAHRRRRRSTRNRSNSFKIKVEPCVISEMNRRLNGDCSQSNIRPLAC